MLYKMVRFNLHLVVVVYLLINISITSCDPDNDPCPVPKFGTMKFHKTGPNSKYLYNLRSKTLDFSEIQQTCQDLGLEMAEVHSKADFDHLANFSKETPGLRDRNWAIGLKDDVTEGEFLYHDGTAIQFQAFWRDEPDDGEGGSDCVELSFAEDRSSSPFAMFDVPCSKQAYPLCQWLKSNPCNYNSPTTLNHKENTIKMIGDTTTRKYFVSTMQKTWSEALLYCGRRHKKLVDFNQENVEDIESIHRFSRSHIIQLGLHDFQGFWTSGQYEKDGDVNNFRWQTTGLMNTNVSGKYWKWVPGEPEDSRVDNIETCIAYFAPYVAGDPPKPLLSATNCNIPYYFLCYEDTPFGLDTNKTDSNGLGSNSESDENLSEMTTDNSNVPCLISPIPSIKLNRPGFSPKDSMTLALLNTNKNLAGNRALIDFPTKWKRDFVKTLADLTKRTCPDEQVPHGFINVMKNFILIYLKNIKSTSGNITTNRVWPEVARQLFNCVSNIKQPLNMTSSGATVYLVEGHHVLANAETVDGPEYSELDIVIDAFWFMYQLSVGICYPGFDSKTTFLVEYFFSFKNEFIEDLVQRWMLAGFRTGVNYGGVIGDYDMGSAIYNLRICSTAAHMKNHIDDRMIARPIFLNMHGHAHEIPNEKTGHDLHPKLYTS